MNVGLDVFTVFISKGLFCATVFYVKEDLLIYYVISRCGKRVIFYTSFSTCLEVSYAGGCIRRRKAWN